MVPADALGGFGNPTLEHNMTPEIARKQLATLSAREAQVLDCVLAGQSNKQIAANLHISDRTVENHRANIYDKLKVGNAVLALQMLILASGGQVPSVSLFLKG